jgi:D-2-hydroxyacid dehydrogenase (NADP+)
MADVLIALDEKGSDYFSFPERELAALRARFPEERIACVPPEALEEEIGEARALLCWQFPKKLLERARRLEFIMYAADGMGPRRLYPELIASEVAVTNSRGSRAPAMAEHAVGALLGLSRRLFEARDHQRQRRWAKDELIRPPLPSELHDAPVVVVGLGEVGRRISTALSQGFGARVTAVRARPELGGAGRVLGVEQLHEALRGAAAVLLALPPTSNTARLLDARGLAAMRPGAFVVNVGRGDAVDEGALLLALREGQIGGAALDVFAEEPLPERSPLWELPRVFITPHSSGVTPALWPRVAEIFGENLSRSAEGKPLQNLVDKERGY